MKETIIYFDNLWTHDFCGYFNSDTDLNNGYGCDHPENEEKEYCDIMKREQGKCYTFSCPIAYSITMDNDEDVEIMRKQILEDYGEDYLVKEFGHSGEISKDELVDFYGGEETDYMIVHDEEIIKKINGNGD